jgi:hypothetical protein
MYRMCLACPMWPRTLGVGCLSGERAVKACADVGHGLLAFATF